MPQVLGAVVRRYGHFDAAEDAVQEALIDAASQWPEDGRPVNPRGWLITVASRKLINLLRGEQARQRREDTVAGWTLPQAWLAPAADRPDGAEPADDSLILLLMCCHPSLSPEAIRLARMVHRQLPDDGEVTGLLALMLLTDARRPARTGPAGELILMAEQDRTLWHAPFVAEGVALITAALPRGAVGPYQLQAAIAAIHDEAPSAEQTDWPQIVALYELLMRLSDNPVVALNHAVAVAMASGPQAGLDLLAASRRTTSLPLQRYLNARAARLTG